MPESKPARRDSTRDSPGSENTRTGGEAPTRTRRLPLALAGGLLVLLVTAMLGGWAWLRAREADRQRQAAAAVIRARRALRQMDIEGATRALGAAARLDPRNPAVARVAVSVFYAGGDLEAAVAQFNDAAAHNDETLGQEELQYLRDQGALWSLARRIVGERQTARSRALALCNWFALYVQPIEVSPVPAEPMMVIWTGRGTPAEITWTYAEMARQAGVACKVIALPGGAYLVSVLDEEGERFLLDPVEGVPFISPDDGDLQTLADLPDSYEAYERLMQAAGRQAPPQQEFLDSLQVKAAAHPLAVTRRMHAFQDLLKDLRPRPVLAVNPEAEGIEEPADLWAAPRRIRRAARSSTRDEDALAVYEQLQLVTPARHQTVLGHFAEATAAYREAMAGVRGRIREAEDPTAAAPLEQALEDLSFFAATNASEAGALERAAALVDHYLQEYPDGRWTTLARLLQAELALAQGQEADWPQEPAERRLYVALRRSGRLGPPETLAPAPTRPPAAPAGQHPG